MAEVTAKPRTSLLVSGALLLFAAGVVIGLGMGESPASGSRPPERESPVAAALAPEVEEPIAPLPTDSPFADLDPGPVPIGDGVIGGSVVTEDGRPLAGVTVRAEPSADYAPPPRGGPPPPGDPNLPTCLAVVRQLLLERAGVREAVSDRHGRFLLTGVTDASQSIRAYKPGYRIGRKGDGRTRAGEEVEFVARAVVELGVHVIDVDGRPPEYCLIEFEQSGGSSGHRPWTARVPAIEFNPGPLRLKAVTPDGYRFASQTEERHLVAGVRPEPVVLRLEERAGICGTLNFPPIDTFGHVGYRFAALRIRPDVPPDPARLTREYHAECSLGSHNPSRGTGSFSMVDLPVGTYLVGVLDGHSEVLDTRIVELKDGMVEIELAVPMPGVGAAITLRVLGPDGGALEHHVSVQARHLATDGTTTSGSRTDSLGKGTWRVLTPAVPEGKEAGGRYVILINSATHGNLSVDYDPRRAGEVEARFAEPATLTVIFPNYPGSPYEGAVQIVAEPDRPRGEQPSSPKESRPGPRGQTTLGPLAPGDWIVRLQVDTGTWGSTTILGVPVRLSSGHQELVLDPPPLHNLTVEVPEGEATWRLEPKGAGQWLAQPEARDGTLRFLRLTPGEYVLRCYAGAKSEGMTIQLDRDLTLRFAAEVLDALRVSIFDQEGALHAAGLREGDRIVRIADTEIESASQAWALIQEKMAAGPQVLNVLRGATSFTVPLDLLRVFDRRAMGGTLQSWPR